MVIFLKKSFLKLYIPSDVGFIGAIELWFLGIFFQATKRKFLQIFFSNDLRAIKRGFLRFFSRHQSHKSGN